MKSGICSGGKIYRSKYSYKRMEFETIQSATKEYGQKLNIRQNK